MKPVPQRAILARLATSGAMGVVSALVASCSIASGWGDLQNGGARTLPDGSTHPIDGSASDGSSVQSDAANTQGDSGAGHNDAGDPHSGCTADSCATTEICCALIGSGGLECTAPGDCGFPSVIMRCTSTHDCASSGGPGGSVCCLHQQPGFAAATCSTQCFEEQVCDPQASGECFRGRSCQQDTNGVYVCR